MSNAQYPYPYPCNMQRQEQTYAAPPVSSPPPQAAMSSAAPSPQVTPCCQLGEARPADAQMQLQQEVQAPLVGSIIVPEGFVAGMKLQYTASDGQELRLTVPEGVPPGSVMTLTQDPFTKQWKCMASPAEPSAENPSAVSMGPVATAERVTTYVAGHPPMVTTYGSQSQFRGHHFHHVMPVNLSYVPPPGAAGMTCGAARAPGQGAVMRPSSVVIPEPRFNYAPPSVILPRTPSYTPPPVMPTISAPLTGPVMDMSWNRAGHLGPQMPAVPQRPSYVPPPMLPGTIMQSSGSYVPPPAPLPSLQPPYPSDMQAMSNAHFNGSYRFPGHGQAFQHPAGNFGPGFPHGMGSMTLPPGASGYVPHGMALPPFALAPGPPGPLGPWMPQMQMHHSPLPGPLMQPMQPMQPLHPMHPMLSDTQDQGFRQMPLLQPMQLQHMQHMQPMQMGLQQAYRGPTLASTPGQFEAPTGPGYMQSQFTGPANSMQ